MESGRQVTSLVASSRPDRVIAAKSERIGSLAHGGDAKSDVLFDGNAQLLGPFADIVSVNAASEGFIFQLAFHGVGLDLENALAGLDQRAGGEKSGQFVA